MNRERSQIGYDAEELYFHELNQEQIRKIKATLEQEGRPIQHPSSSAEDIPLIEDDEYSEAA